MFMGGAGRPHTPRNVSIPKAPLQAPTSMADEVAAGPSSRPSAAELPFGPVSQLVSDVLPPGVTAGSDVARLMQGYLGEFLDLMTAQANERAEAENKNTISEAHMLGALDDLGFGHQTASLSASASASADSAPSMKRQKKGKRGALPPGMTEEESLRLQQELFAQAKAAMTGSTPVL